MSDKKFWIGVDYGPLTDIKHTMSECLENGYTFMSTTISHPFNVRDIPSVAEMNYLPFTRSDIESEIQGNDWMQILCKLSDWIDCDSEDVKFRRLSENIFNQEYDYIMHLGARCMFTLHSSNHINLARVLFSKLDPATNYITKEIFIRVPMVNPEILSTTLYQNMEVKNSDTWHWWVKFHRLCKNNRNVVLALELAEDLPDMPELNRWLGEPVRCLIIPTDIFLTNKAGYPVLSVAHQAFVRKVANFVTCEYKRSQSDIHVMVTGRLKFSEKYYFQYLDHVLKYPKKHSLGTNEKVYADFLQEPLQPLRDNLESSTYAVFELDPIKYTQYEEAIYKALIDRVPEDLRETTKQVIMVVGAGRGPLVTASLKAAVRADIKVKVYAVDKNPNAYITLCSKKKLQWIDDDVEVINCDMRLWQPNENCDILVSELLGSFGDNELSPECLDGAQRFLKDDGISIPCKYTSYLSPIHSVKLHNQLSETYSRIKESDNFEIPYVVHQVNANNMSSTKACFTFEHPNRGKIDNNRYAKLEFDVNVDSLLHGFSGYFDAELYKDVIISIHPETHSLGMYSWFAMYFPIKEPILVKKGEMIVVHFWRVVDNRDVWYEWCISEPECTHIHNSKGKCYKIGLM